jgi:hypothetical protein
MLTAIRRAVAYRFGIYAAIRRASSLVSME